MNVLDFFQNILGPACVPKMTSTSREGRDARAMRRLQPSATKTTPLWQSLLTKIRKNLLDMVYPRGTCFIFFEFFPGPLVAQESRLRHCWCKCNVHYRGSIILYKIEPTTTRLIAKKNLKKLTKHFPPRMNTPNFFRMFPPPACAPKIPPTAKQYMRVSCILSRLNIPW